MTDPSALAGATEPGPPNTYPRTPGEFAARWNSWTEDQRAEWLVHTISACEAAQRRRFAEGGYVIPPSEAITLDTAITIAPDECALSGAGIRDGRLVCIRADHPTERSGCRAGAGREQ